MKSDQEKLCNILGGMAEDQRAGAGVLMRDFVAEYIGGPLDVAALIDVWKAVAARAHEDEKEELILLTLAGYGAATFLLEEMRRIDDAKESEGA